VLGESREKEDGREVRRGSNPAPITANSRNTSPQCNRKPA